MKKKKNCGKPIRDIDIEIQFQHLLLQQTNYNCERVEFVFMSAVFWRGFFSSIFFSFEKYCSSRSCFAQQYLISQFVFSLNLNEGGKFQR